MLSAVTNRNDIEWRGRSCYVANVIILAQRMLTDWNKSHFSSSARASATSRWTPPSVNWLKKNVDASTRTSSSFVGIGCMVRDSNSSFMTCRAWRFSEFFNAKIAKATTVRKTLSWLRLHGWQHVILETDSQSVAQAINNRSFGDDSGFGLLLGL
uniref:RNase H type-1 domain-containing protein n=1 Tax=Manihot esculenta TaxID=3983 RepID=A0A2C9VAI7_MANES